MLGILGALDPYRHKQTRGEIDDHRLASIHSDERAEKEGNYIPVLLYPVLLFRILCK